MTTPAASFTNSALAIGGLCRQRAARGKRVARSFTRRRTQRRITLGTWLPSLSSLPPVQPRLACFAACVVPEIPPMPLFCSAWPSPPPPPPPAVAAAGEACSVAPPRCWHAFLGTLGCARLFGIPAPKSSTRSFARKRKRFANTVGRVAFDQLSFATFEVRVSVRFRVSARVRVRVRVRVHSTSRVRVRSRSRARRRVGVKG